MMPTDPAQQSANDSVRRFFGGALMAIGVLVMVLCGLCTSLLAISVLSESPGDFFGVLLEGIAVAAIPAAIGAAVFFLGRAIMPLKAARPPHPNPPPQGGRE